MITALAIVLYVLGCVLAHTYYNMVNDYLNQEGMEIPTMARWGHIVAWPLAMLMYLIMPSREKNSEDDS